MQSQTESDPEEDINKNERASGILFREESYEAVQTKITPTMQETRQLNRSFPSSWLSTHLSADILLILSTPQVTFLFAVF